MKKIKVVQIGTGHDHSFAPVNSLKKRTDKDAVKKQKAFIKLIHDMSKEVLMSSHIIYDNTFKFVPKEKVLEVALEQESRGADIAKIVSNADTEEELLENFEAITLCKKNSENSCAVFV